MNEYEIESMYRMIDEHDQRVRQDTLNRKSERQRKLRARLERQDQQRITERFRGVEFAATQILVTHSE
jgi:hypothetical protein